MSVTANARRLIICADDFGLDVAVNEAVERAHSNGILTCTSLMMGEKAVSDAVERAKRLPKLGVGLHIVLTAGQAVSNPSEIPNLVAPDGRFDDNMARAGVRYFFLPHVRQQLRTEIRAQFETFRATGLKLDHVNAHRHFHLHPTLANMILEIGRDYGMKAMRLPYEPMKNLRLASPTEAMATPLYQPWVRMLGLRLRMAGMHTNENIFGLRWSGGMDEKRVGSILENLPDGVTEIYFHPATLRTEQLKHLMPDYRHTDEFSALISPAMRELLAKNNISLINFAQMADISA
jgi:hopanoid biosynthesis associated protein HpnK